MIIRAYNGIQCLGRNFFACALGFNCHQNDCCRAIATSINPQMNIPDLAYASGWDYQGPLRCGRSNRLSHGSIIFVHEDDPSLVAANFLVRRIVRSNK